MKRPFAIIGFSMAVSSLILVNISYNATVTVICAATVAFLFFICLRNIRGVKTLLTIIGAFLVFSLNFLWIQGKYANAVETNSGEQIISGTVCQSPSKSDYAYTYIIKADGKNYKIMYVAENDRGFQSGDKVSGKIFLETNDEDPEYFESAMASKTYFVSFETEKYALEKIGGRNFWYWITEYIRSSINAVISKYLPGENGAIAKAMTMGDKSGISGKTVDNFNYAGTSHLLVVSGLHLSMWSLGLIKILRKFKKTRKYMIPIAFVSMFFYCAITGFGISVIRAGIMVGTVLTGKLFYRGADSVNSIGVAITGILLANPFSVYSTAFWLSMLSTLGIVIYSEKILNLIYKSKFGSVYANSGLFRFFVSVFCVSVAAAVFTLPVYIIKLKMLPAFSFFANLLMVDAAMVLMFISVLAVLLHFIRLVPLAKSLFAVVGIIGEYLQFVAEKIGLSKWSTLPLTHKYYMYFLFIAAAGVILILVAGKLKKDITKSVSTVLTVIFLCISLYCVSFDFNTPSLNVITDKSGTTLIVCSHGKSLLVGNSSKRVNSKIKRALNSHNIKTVDYALIAKQDKFTPSEIANLYNNFNVNKTLSVSENLLYSAVEESNVRKINVGENLIMNFGADGDYTEILSENLKVLIIDGEIPENPFEKSAVYDIIIVTNLSETQNLDSFDSLAEKDTEIIFLIPEEGTKELSLYLR